MQETYLQKFQRLFNDIEKNISSDITYLGKIGIAADFLWEKFRYDIELIDYIQYQFYFKKRKERDKFITHGKLIKIIKICNAPDSRKYFDQKPLFNKHFDKYLGREWCDMSSCDKKQMLEFLRGKHKIFAKCPDGMFGRGIEVIDIDEIKDVDEFYQLGKKNKLLLEEVLTQHQELAEFNSTSVNSLRVVTLICADGTVRVMAGVLRIGRKGKIADNFHHKGIAALIDVETGIVSTVGVDREWNRYVQHPDSKKTIVGFKIPKWEQITETVCKAAMLHPEVRYVGWDVTIKENGQIVLIEGNPGADPDVTQIEDQIGKWSLYEPLIKEIEKIKR